MARATLPEKLTGDFFVLSYNRETEIYTIAVDDEDGNSYKLGSNIENVMLQFRLWGLPELGNRSIDIAREFGMAQAIFSDGRVIPQYQKPKPPVLKFRDEEEDDHVVIPKVRIAH